MSKTRKIIQYDLEGNKLRTFESIKEAQALYGCTHISTVCRGVRTHDGGFRWKYVEDAEKEQVM